MPLTILSNNKKFSYKWLQFPKTCHEELDQQHQILLDRMNAIKEKQSQETKLATLQLMLAKLQTLFMQHFEYEEQQMLARGYSLFSDHFEEHQKFLTGSWLTLTLDAQGHIHFNLDALIQWNLYHINHFDRPMAEYLLAHT
ncbi:MAG: hypothetical protein HQL93_13685 [Magnetococcales bacterium]|nr:hypothetical protein [Magnetococcales bacterium]